MNRKEKINYLKRLREGKENISDLLIKNSLPLPSWYWQQFDIPEDLINDLKNTRGEKISVIWKDGKPYCIDLNKRVKKFNWFENEK